MPSHLQALTDDLTGAITHGAVDLHGIGVRAEEVRALPILDVRFPQNALGDVGVQAAVSPALRRVGPIAYEVGLEGIGDVQHAIGGDVVVAEPEGPDRARRPPPLPRRRRLRWYRGIAVRWGWCSWKCPLKSKPEIMPAGPGATGPASGPAGRRSTAERCPKARPG